MIAIFLVGFVAQSITIGYRFFMPSGKHPYLKTFTCFFSDIPDGYAKEIHLRGNRLILTNNKGNIMAFSASCPHLGCSVTWEMKEKIFLCPCHMAAFDNNGQVIKGPPPGPLNQYKVLIESNSVFVYVQDNLQISEV